MPANQRKSVISKFPLRLMPSVRRVAEDFSLKEGVSRINSSMLPWQRRFCISSTMNGWQLDRNHLRHALHEHLRSWTVQARMRPILAMSCQTVMRPSARRMSTNKLWVRNESFIGHAVI